MKHIKQDKAVYESIKEELNRQRNKLEMIASENFTRLISMPKAIRGKDIMVGVSL